MEHSSDAGSALLEFYERFAAGDVDRFTAGLTADEDAALVIGTDPAQWHAGRTTWLSAYAAQVEALPGLRVEPGEPVCHAEGAVGWCADRPTFVLPDGSRIAARVTAVFRREGDDWKAVTAHFSIGVPDERLGDVLAWSSQTEAAGAQGSV